MTAMTKPKRPAAAPSGATPEPASNLPALPLEPKEDPCAPPPEVYDPADFRWVPVRRRARYDGWTEEKQRRFIEVLADTGQVSHAAKAVGLTRVAAYQLRRQPHAAAFARAWDAARGQAGSFIEDVAFERALEGVEHNVYNVDGEVVCTKRVYNDRLLMFLLRSLKPERYARHALASLQTAPPKGATIDAEPCAELNASLAAMEPPLPVPVQELLDPETLDAELEIADIADGKVPQFLSEQRWPKLELTPKQAKAAKARRGAALEHGDTPFLELTDAEREDVYAYYDTLDPPPKKRKRYR